MTREEYNVELQDMQRFVFSVGLQDRIETQRSALPGEIERPYTGPLRRAVYQVYWDGAWVTLGEEIRPLTPECSRQWWDIVATKLKASVVDCLTR